MIVLTFRHEGVNALADVDGSAKVLRVDAKASIYPEFSHFHSMVDLDKSLCRGLPEGKSHQIPWNHHFPVVFPWFSYVDGFVFYGPPAVFFFWARYLWTSKLWRNIISASC